MKKRHNINIFILTISIIIAVALFTAIYYPKLQGELKTDLNAVYLDDLNPDYDMDLTSFTKNDDIKDKLGASIGRGIELNLADGTGSRYTNPTFHALYKINSKFERLTGKLILLEHENIQDRIIEINITADKGFNIYHTQWDLTKQSTINIDIPLNKVRILEISLRSDETYDGQYCSIGLVDFAVVKGNATPTEIVKEHKKEPKVNLRSILLLPKAVNHPEDASHLRVRGVNHSNHFNTIANDSELFFQDFRGDMNFSLIYNNNLDPIALKAEDIKMTGGTFEAEFTYNNGVVLKNINPTSQKPTIYIPRGTLIGKDGYTLQEDFIIKNITIVSSVWEGIGGCLKRFVPFVLLVISIIIVPLIIRKLLFPKSNAEFPLDACIANILISYVLCIPVFGLVVGLDNSFLSNGYKNDIGILIFLLLTAVPCSVAVIYRILMTIRYNMKFFGIVGGSFAFIFEVIITITGFYIIGMILGGALFGSIATAKVIMDRVE